MDCERISIIVPAYNTEKYIGKAIESVIAQSYGNWQLLLIDDGSTDGTSEICLKYSKLHQSIEYYRKENGGLSDARNYGIDRASGNFIAFLDADDFLHPDALKILMEGLKSNDADICCGGYMEFEDDEELASCRHKKIEFSSYPSSKAVELALYQRKIYHSAWGKLYKRELFSNVRFRKGTWYEDLDCFYKIWLQCNRIVNTPAPIYYYRQHRESYLHIFNKRRLDVLAVTERMENWIAANKIELLAAAQDRRMSANFNIIILMHKHRQRWDEVERQCWAQIKRLRRKSIFNPHVRMKNRIGAALSFLIK